MKPDHENVAKIGKISHNGKLYEDLSSYYDRFCAGVDYTIQCNFAERVFACFVSSGGKEYLDLACGTGLHMKEMWAKGFQVAGLDNCPAMLEEAHRACPAAELFLCDLAGFEFRERFDLITCFLYSILYSHPVSALKETLHRAASALKPGGVIVFDMVDKNGISHRDVITRLEEEGHCFTFCSGWRYSGHGETLDLHVSITREGADGEQRWEDRHRMTAVSIREVMAIMNEAGLEIHVLERDFSSLRPWGESSFNVLMVGRKPVGHDSVR